VIRPDNTSTLLRARAWRERPGCVHVVVVNSVEEGGTPQPATLVLGIAGLLDDEVAAGVVPLWSDCVVNFTSPSDQTYACRSLPLVPTSLSGGRVSHEFSDSLGATAAKVYRIGCTMDSNSGNDGIGGSLTELVFDGGFEQSQQPGVPGYHLADHSAFWHIDYTDTFAGDRNGRGYDDRSWLTIDPRLPHSGRSSLRAFVPTERSVLIALPCAAPSGKKSGPACSNGALMAVNGSSLAVSLSVRGWPVGGKVEIVTGVFPSPQREWFNETAVLATLASTDADWRTLSAMLPAVDTNPVGLTVCIRLTTTRPTNFWIDDVTASASSALT
jgi:hypothetical protein